jgi:hypothetical protein
VGGTSSAKEGAEAIRALIRRRLKKVGFVFILSVS